MSDYSILDKLIGVGFNKLLKNTISYAVETLRYHGKPTRAKEAKAMYERIGGDES
jgi:hypothetical protein